MKKWIPVLFAALFIWNVGLKITLVSDNVSSSSSITVDVSDDVNARKYLTEVTSIVDSARASLVRIDAYTEDRAVSGNGVIYSNVDNIVYIFTPYNLVHGASYQTVTFDSGVTIDGYLIGEDFTSGLALLACYPPFSVRTMTLGNSDAVVDGQYVAAVSARRQESAAVISSFGIVSSSGMYRTSILSRIYTDMLAVDFSITEDMYGGALMNIKGEIVGILVSSPFQSITGCGYALSINEAKLVYDQLLYKGSVTRGNPGIVYREVSYMESYEKNQLDIPLDQNTGMLITHVWDEGAAQHTLKAGDVILSADGESLTTAQVFRRILYSHNPGDTVDLVFLSDGEQHSISLMLK